MNSIKDFETKESNIKNESTSPEEDIQIGEKVKIKKVQTH